MSRQSETKLQFALRQVQLRAQLKLDRELTHGEMAEMAGVTARSFGDWMRGVSSPNGMSAVFELLSQLPESDVLIILKQWKERDN